MPRWILFLLENSRVIALERLARMVLLIMSLTAMLPDCVRGQTEEATTDATANTHTPAQLAAELNREKRRELQSQELMLAKSGTWIFKPSETPRILWRDVEAYGNLGAASRCVCGGSTRN